MPRTHCVLQHTAIPTSKSGKAFLYFHYASGFTTQILAYMLDSLVRVTRRVDENHFVRITTDENTCYSTHWQKIPSNLMLCIGSMRSIRDRLSRWSVVRGLSTSQDREHRAADTSFGKEECHLCSSLISRFELILTHQTHEVNANQRVTHTSKDTRQKKCD